jgi:hypothetical protein
MKWRTIGARTIAYALQLSILVWYEAPKQRLLAIRLASGTSDASAKAADAAREEYHRRERARH